MSTLDLFASELRRARSAVGLSQDQLAAEVNYSASLIAMVETAKRTPSRDFAARCDEALKTDGLLGRILSAVNLDTAPEWFRPWIALEREATTLRSSEPSLIPGLLQTPDYTRALLGASELSEEEIETAAASRMQRREVLDADQPPMLVVLIDEGVLRRPIGGPRVMQEQLTCLAEVAQRPRVRVQVVPFGVGAHPGLNGAFVIASFDGSPDVLYLETVARGIVSGEPKDVAAAQSAWESLRCDALPRRQSHELIEEVARSWKA